MPLGAHARAEPCTKVFFITTKYTKVATFIKLTDNPAAEADFITIKDS